MGIYVRNKFQFFRHFYHCFCAGIAEVLKMVFLRFLPEQILIKGPKASGCFHAND